VNNSAGVFRLPDDYDVFRIKEERPEGRPSASTPGGDEAWHVAFDSSPQPDADHAGDDAPGHVAGQAIVFPLAATVGDAVSAVSLRSFFLGQDPIELYQSDDPDIESSRSSASPRATVCGAAGS
jgi:hypothetical protein